MPAGVSACFWFSKRKDVLIGNHNIIDEDEVPTNREILPITQGAEHSEQPQPDQTRSEQTRSEQNGFSQRQGRVPTEIRFHVVNTHISEGVCQIQ